MTRALTILAAFLLIVHGLIHLLGTAVYARRHSINGLPYKTKLLGGRWDLGDAGIRVFGWLWVLPALGFVAAAAGLLAGRPSWEPLLLAVTIFSLVITLLDWSSAYMGAVIDVLILMLVFLHPRIMG